MDRRRAFRPELLEREQSRPLSLQWSKYQNAKASANRETVEALRRVVFWNEDLAQAADAGRILRHVLERA